MAIDLPALAADSLAARLLTDPTYLRVLVGTACIALVSGVLSVFVVLKRMAFIGQGISHAAFGGAGVALLLGLYVPAVRPALGQDVIIAVFCVLTAVAIGHLSRRGRLTEDASIGICLAGAMALGMLLIDLRALLYGQLLAGGQLSRQEVGYSVDLGNLLFGDVLMSFGHWADVAVAGALAAGVVLAVLALYKELVFFAFDSEAATVFGVPGGVLYYGLLVALGLAVVAAMRTMGVILTSALLVLPGATARCGSRQIGWVFLASTLTAVGGALAGFYVAVWLSAWVDVSVGPVIVLTLFAIFVVAYLLRTWRDRADRAQNG